MYRTVNFRKNGNRRITGILGPNRPPVFGASRLHRAWPGVSGAGDRAQKNAIAHHVISGTHTQCIALFAGWRWDSA
jgi:hypothetical protein